MRKIWIILTLLSASIIMGWVAAPREARGGDAGANTETCKMCHQDRYAGYAKSIHANKALRRSPANERGCESCHGPGTTHIQKGGGRGTGMIGFSKGKVDAAVKSAQCLACHADFRNLAFWDMSKHQSSGISCDSCHSIHSGQKKNLKSAQPDLCLSCHRDVRGQIAKQSHHPLREGKVKCTDCHEPHGGFGTKMVKAGTANELCYKCHAEKRGPFLWEHPPVEENCQTCHTVHGSNHLKLLTNRTPQLCETCHDNTGHVGNLLTSFNTFQGSAPSNRLYARACLNCHSEIHGSTGPSSRGRFFVR